MTMLRVLTTWIAARQALLTAAIVALALALFSLAALAAVERSARAAILQTIDTDIVGLTDILLQGGVPELQKRIADRTDFAAEGGRAYYYVANGAGHRLAGNTAGLPQSDVSRSASFEIAVGDDPVLMRATRLRGGLTLAVGRSLRPVHALTTELLRALATAAAVIVGGAVLVGASAAYHVASRIVKFNDVFARFEGGHLGARIDSRSGAELLALTGHINVHLGKVEALLKAQRAISDNVAHELRTPLVHLDTRLLAALDHAREPIMIDELEAARGDIRAIVSLFDALLDLTLLETASATGGLPACDLSELVSRVAELYAASAEEAGLGFVMQIAPDIVMAGDAMQLSRIVTNLLDNAIKFCPPGSTIRVSLSLGPRLTVEDDGPGIAAADRARVFGRLWRSDSAAAGHGLGLSLVKVLAARHGLTARVEDAAPGARFVITREKAAA